MPEGERPKSLYRLGADESATWINHLVFGHPGIGKTPYWGTAAKGLLMDSDNGTESAEAAGSTLHVVPCPGFKQVSEVFQYMAYGGGCKEYDWVIWDSGTLFMDRVMVDELIPDAAAQNPREDPDVASQRSYLVLQNRFGDYVRRFVGLPINFGMSAHVMVAEDPDGNSLYIPNFPGRKGEYSNKISGYFNLVTYYGMTPKTGTRRFLTEKTGYYFSRDRFHAVRTPTADGSVGRLNNPTVPKVEELIAQARKKRKAKHGQGQGPRRQGSRQAGTRRR